MLVSNAPYHKRTKNELQKKRQKIQQQGKFGRRELEMNWETLRKEIIKQVQKGQTHFLF